MTEPGPLHIVQIAPDIAPGSGVGGVAFALEQEFRSAGVVAERFTLDDARRRPRGDPGISGNRLVRAWQVVWFSTVGTQRARRFLATRAAAVSICHNDVMTGDIYVSHGLVQPAMRARGNYAWRMVRNPVHIFTALRDRIRYRGESHRAVVALTRGEAELLRATYGRVHPPITVIPNGVDLVRFLPPTPAEQDAARAAMGLALGARTAIFLGHEFERKGLDLAIDALPSVTGLQLLVVGGAPDSIRTARSRAAQRGVADRVVFAGTLPDPVPALHAADVLVLPSAYEANALVILEALACGVPVVCTRVGSAPDIVVDGEAGYLVDRDPDDLAARLQDVLAADRDGWSRRARATAETYSWAMVARQYLDLAERLRRSPTTTDRAPTTLPEPTEGVP